MRSGFTVICDYANVTSHSCSTALSSRVITNTEAFRKNRANTSARLLTSELGPHRPTCPLPLHKFCLSPSYNKFFPFFGGSWKGRDLEKRNIDYIRANSKTSNLPKQVTHSELGGIFVMTRWNRVNSSDREDLCGQNPRSSSH
jgi:hypothetical protein